MNPVIPAISIHTVDVGEHVVEAAAYGRETGLKMAHDIRVSPIPVTALAVNHLASLDGKQVHLCGVAIADADGNWLAANVSVHP